MKFEGRVFFGSGAEPDAFVTDAVITPQRISIDWLEDGESGHLDAKTSDGHSFGGHYGYPHADSNLEFELRQYRLSGGEGVLLFGTWRELDSGQAGIWAFQLWPLTGKSMKKTRSKKRA